MNRNALKQVSNPIGITVMAKILQEVCGIKQSHYAGPYKIVGNKGDQGYVLESKDGVRDESYANQK